ncbi:adenylate/guanylate cyclase domain-containing protein [Azospirillum canadense]|uniref:adenylate/guanylate cyclase domain-containing protein n=1 Tax=Azospirillum canadense TaxID=403962 RepID=UPI0022272B65|nr:adenylate/guanylate cyclase domain-containing protein [Azospirillum canadense]MCW2235581.1 adenylate cyclase [Azospirillum canadense]
MSIPESAAAVPQPDLPPGLPSPCPPDRARAVSDWLLREGRHADSVQQLMDRFCHRLMAAGVPLLRVVCALPLLHPQIRTIAFFWRRNAENVEVATRAHGTETSTEYLTSPFATLIEDGAEGLRYRLEQMEPPWPYPVFAELREQGATDYVAMTVLFAGGRRNVLSFTTDRPGGFSTADLALVDAVLPALGAVLETLALRRLAATVLDTYVGRQSGTRILSGDIRRGTGANVRAVLWYCDLRGFTPLADRLPREELIALLNDYFEIMGGSVEQHGGEILKFIGDAMLAIFPLEDGDHSGAAACTKALDAAEDALKAMNARNAERAAWGQPTLRCGIALHLGDVMYGNIGSANRLDFTVIGPAVNLVSRIEGLCNRLDRTILTSAEIAATCGDRLVSVGWHPVKGLHDPIEVYGLKG